MDQALLDWFRTVPGELPEPAPRRDPGTPDITRATVVTAHPDRREQLLADYLCQEIGSALHQPAEAVDREETMSGLGVGSMIGFELRNRIKEALGVAPELADILRAGNVRELALRLEGLLA